MGGFFYFAVIIRLACGASVMPEIVVVALLALT
jgi:hypothetical protein